MDKPVRSMFVDVVEREAVQDDLYRVTIAANEKARQPPDVDFAGLSTENYARNPVVMWAHDVAGNSPSGGLPIGRTVDLSRTRDGRLVVDFEFLSDDSFAQRVRNAWDKGFLRAASISWLPLESTPEKGGRWRDTKSELLEWSIVPVPADPDALRDAHRRLLDEVLADSNAPDEVRCAVGDSGSASERGPAELSEGDLREILRETILILDRVVNKEDQ